MRPLLAAVIAGTILGGLWLYMQCRPTRASAGPVVAEPTQAKRIYSLELTTSFQAEPDPFALVTSAGDVPPAVLVRLLGQDVVRLTDRVSAGQSITVEIPGLVVGPNELYLEANPPPDQIDRSHAVRLRIVRDDQVVAERTYWSAAGGRVTAAFPFTIQPEHPRGDDHHDHAH